MKDGEDSARAEPDTRERRTLAEPHEISSRELLRESREVRIRHRGEIYTLRQTSSGKLILTK